MANLLFNFSPKLKKQTQAKKKKTIWKKLQKKSFKVKVQNEWNEEEKKWRKKVFEMILSTVLSSLRSQSSVKYALVDNLWWMSIFLIKISDEHHMWKKKEKIKKLIPEFHQELKTLQFQNTCPNETNIYFSKQDELFVQ